MANEIKILTQLNYQNGTAKYDFMPGQLSLPQTTKGFMVQTVTATTTPAAVSFAQVATPSRFWIQSLEATTTGKNVKVSVTSSSTVTATYGQLCKAKEIIQSALASSGATVTLQAESASSTVQLLIIALNA